MAGNPYTESGEVLIGNNIVNIGASAYAAILFTEIFGSGGVGIATGVMTFFILIFGEIVPKSFAHEHSSGLSLFMAKPIYGLQVILFPFIWFFVKIVKLTQKWTGSKSGYTVTEGELVAMLKIGTEEGSIEKQEQEFIENVLEFNDIKVEEVMTPRVTIDALDEELTLKEAIAYAIKHSHTRLPVYKENLDNIVGVISIKNLLVYSVEESSSKKLKDMELNIPLEVPFSKKINKLFRELQRRHVHIAIVIDEYGGTAGLVTLEDLLEEIVGEIVDETDVEEKSLEIVDKNTLLAKGDALVEDVNDFFKVKFGNNDRDSISTMVLEHIHRFPREGEIIKFPQGKVEILKMKKKTLEKVRITRFRV